jgi:hypothetical protein
MDTQRAQMKGVLPWLVSWACRAGIRDFCSTLAALVAPVQAGQAAVLGRLSFSKCLWSCAKLGQMNYNTCS